MAIFIRPSKTRERKYSARAKRREFAKRPLVERIASVEAMIHSATSRVPRQDREDVYQDIVTELVRSDRSYSADKGAYSTWVCWRIMKIMAHRKYRLSVRGRRGLVLSLDRNDSLEGGGNYDPESKHERPEDSIIGEESRRMLHQWMGALNDRERRVIKDRFGFSGREMSLREIGDNLGISKESARKVQATAIGQMRAMAVNAGLMDAGRRLTHGD